MSKCAICNSELRVIPAGVSKKTGKPYNAFEVCPNKCPKANYGAPKGTYSDSKGSPANLNGNPDVYDLLTDINARTKKILEILQKEMPTDPFNEV